LLAKSKSNSRATLGFSTKSYFGHKQLSTWLSEIANFEPETEIQTFLVPSFPSLQMTLSQSPQWILVGAQDCSAYPSGAHTGEVSAELLAELGVDFVALGHAEVRARRDTNSIVAEKVSQVTQNGLDVLLCVGEIAQASIESAAAECIQQIELAGVKSDNSVIAYEPVWAIGGQEPASIEHIIGTVALIRQHFGETGPRVIYGGAAGPGLFEQIFPTVEGLFLGRMVHKPEKFRQIMNEAKSSLAGNP
jgi:triosephosphate isomerase